MFPESFANSARNALNISTCVGTKSQATVNWNTLYTVSFTSMEVNDNNMWSIVSPTRITVPAQCTKAFVSFGAMYNAGSATEMQIEIWKNGAMSLYMKESSLTYPANTLTGVFGVTPGDYFEFLGRINSAFTVATRCSVMCW